MTWRLDALAALAFTLALIAAHGSTALAASGAAGASRAGLVIHAVGDGTVRGRGTDHADGFSYSFRRYLYHHLQSQGVAVRFVGSQNDCDGAQRYEGLPPLDFDSRHDGYDNLDTPGVTNKVNDGASDVEIQKRKAVEDLKALIGEDKKVGMVTLIISGGVDAQAGKGRQDISDSLLQNLVGAAEKSNNGAGNAAFKETVIIPSPPPSGKRIVDPETKKVTIERSWDTDIKYEDYRFFLTWRGHFFERRKIAVDCFSSFDFYNHYTPQGRTLNHLGDQALALCVADHLRHKGWIPKLYKVEDGGAEATAGVTLATCQDGSALPASASPFDGAPATSIAKITDGSVPIVEEIAPITALFASGPASPRTSGVWCAGVTPSAGGDPAGAGAKSKPRKSLDDDDDDESAAKKKKPKRKSADNDAEADSASAKSAARKCKASRYLAAWTADKLPVPANVKKAE